MSQLMAFVVDDNLANIEMYGDSLEMARFAYQSALTGKTAINWLETNDAPALITLDMNLPEYDGRQIYQHIRNKEKFANTTIIIATANKYMAEQMQPILHDGDYIMLKPVNLIELQRIATQIRRDAERSEETT